MLYSKLVLWFLMIPNVLSFLHNHVNLIQKRSITMCSNDSNYLEKINNKKVEKMEKIKQNIEKYIIETKKEKKKEPNFQSFYNNPISKINFDKLFMNLNNINNIYLTSDCDRAVFFFKNTSRHVFYAKTKEEKDLIEKIIKYRPDNVKVVIVCDKNLFTDSFGFLYCDK